MRRTSLDRTLAKRDPERVFQSPLDVINEKLLTKGEKIGTLNRWRNTILEELRASGEGMQTYGVTKERAVLLGRIEEARSRLQSN